ncbi:mucin-22-like [Branchiostoma lanceolatum]|uniref:mucin-22-like n=1 Tax=Branchiostoma lanceolatum TaxID=7740 RepID=UPI003451233C
MTASVVAGLPLFPLTVLVLWTTFGALQQTACMPVQPPPSPAHGDGMVPPNIQPTTMDSTTKMDEVDADPATTTPPSGDVRLSTTSVSAETHTTGKHPTTTVPASTTKSGVYSTSTRQTTALQSTIGTHGMGVTAKGTEHLRNATTPATPERSEHLTTSDQGGHAKTTTPASKDTETPSVSEVTKVSESGDGRSGKGLKRGWLGDDSSVLERATTEQPQMSDKMGRNGETYQATTPTTTTQQTITKPATTALLTTTATKHDLIREAVTTTKTDTTSAHQEESTKAPSDSKTAQPQSTTVKSATTKSQSTTVESATTQSQSTRAVTTTSSPSTKAHSMTTQSTDTTTDSTSPQQTQETSKKGQNSKDQTTQQGVSVSSQTTQAVVEMTTLRPTEETTQKHNILQPALPAHTDEREEVATIRTNQEPPQGWLRDGGSVQDGGRSKDVKETGQSEDMGENTTNRNVPDVLTTEPAKFPTTQIVPTSSRGGLDQKLEPVQPTQGALSSTLKENTAPANVQEDKTSQETLVAQTVHLQTTATTPAGTEQTSQKIYYTTTHLEQMIEMENNQGVTQRPDKDQSSTTLQTTIAVSGDDKIATQRSAEMEQQPTTSQPTSVKDDHQLTTSHSAQPISSAETSTATQNENLQTEQLQTKLNNDKSSPTTTLTTGTENVTTQSTAKATTEPMPTDVPRYLEAEVFDPEVVTVQESQDQEERLNKDEQQTISSSQEGGDDSWKEHVEVMVPADVLCEEVPDGMAELPLYADSSISGLHLVSAEDIYQFESSGDRSESKETSEETTEDAGGQSGVDEVTMATTTALSDDAFERILSGEFLQDEGEQVESMSLFADSETGQGNEQKMKQSQQEEGGKVCEEITEKPAQVMELVTEPSNRDRETTESSTQSSNQQRETIEQVTQSSNQERETTKYVTEPTNQGKATTEHVTEPSNQDIETTEQVTQSSNQNRETTEYVTEPSNQGKATTEHVTEPSNKNRETTQYATQSSNQNIETTEVVTEPTNQDRETTEHVTEPSNQGSKTSEQVTESSNQNRETTAVYKSPRVVTVSFDPLLGDEQREDILPTDLIVSSNDGKGSASDKEDTMSTNLQETTQTTTTESEVVTTDVKTSTELTTAVPSKETTMTTNNLSTKKEDQKVISIVSTMPASTTTTVAETTSGSSVKTSETSTAVEKTTSTGTVYPTSSIEEIIKILMETTEMPLTNTATDKQDTTPQVDTLDLDMFTAESDLAAHMIGKITANQEGSKDDSDTVEDEQLSNDAPDPTIEDMFKTDSPYKSKAESFIVDTTLSSTLSQTTEADFSSTQEPLSKEDGTTVQSTLAVGSTEQPKTAEKEATTYRTSNTATETTQATPKIEDTTVTTAQNMQELMTKKAETSSNETKSSTEIQSSMKTATMSSPMEKTLDTGVKEVQPTRNAPALREIITVKLSKMVEVVAQATGASTEQTRTTTGKSAPRTSTPYAQTTTVSQAATSQKSMGNTEKPELMATRGMETTSGHTASTERTTTITQTSPEATAMQTVEGIDGTEEESLNVDGIDTSNQKDEMSNTSSNETAVTVQPTLAALSEKRKKTTEADVSTASKHDVKITTTLPTTTPLFTQTDSTTSAKTTKEYSTSSPVVSTKPLATQKMEEPRRLPAIITVLTAQPPVHKPVTTSEPNLSTATGVTLPEITELDSTSAVIDPTSETATTVESSTSKTEVETVKNADLMTETTSVSVKPTEARAQGATKHATTEGTVGTFLSESGMVTSTVVTEVTTALDYVEILEVDQSASGGETAGSLYLEYPDSEDNAVVPFQQEGEDVKKNTPLDTTTPPSLPPTENMDIHTEMMPKSTTQITPRSTEPTTSSTVTVGGLDRLHNIPSSTKQNTEEMTTKSATTTTANKQSKTETMTTTQKNIKTTSSRSISTTNVPPTVSELDSESARAEHTPTTTRAATATSKIGDQTALDTTISATSLPTTSTYADKTPQPASSSTTAYQKEQTTSQALDRELETSTRVQEMPSSAKILPETERGLPAVISVLTMRPVATTPGTTTIQPKETTKKDSVTTSTAVQPTTELENLTIEKVMPASTTIAVPKTTESPLRRTRTIPQTDVMHTTDDSTPTPQLSINSSDQSSAGKSAGSLHEGQASDNMDMVPTMGQTKGKDVYVSSTTVTPSSEKETSTTFFKTTEVKMSSTLKTTDSSTTQGMPLTTSLSTSGSKNVVTDELTAKTTTKTPEDITLSNPATTSVSNMGSETLQETTPKVVGTTEENLTGSAFAESESKTTTTEPSITQMPGSTTPTVPRNKPVRNAAAIITVLTARPPRVQVQTTFPPTTSSTTTKEASTVAPVEIVEDTTSEHVPISVKTTEMLETNTNVMHVKTNTLAEEDTTALSRSTQPTKEKSVPNSEPFSVTEKVLSEKDSKTTQKTAMTSEMLAEVAEETTVTAASGHVTGFHSTTTDKTTEDKSTMADTQTVTKLSPGPETTKTPLPEETTSVRPTSQSAENEQLTTTESAAEAEYARTTSQASRKGATNGTVVIKETSTPATTPKTMTHVEDNVSKIDDTATTSSESTVTATKETERMVAPKDAALRKMSRTTEAAKTTTAETTVRPTETVRSTSTTTTDKRQEERSTTSVDKTATTTAKPVTTKAPATTAPITTTATNASVTTATMVPATTTTATTASVTTTTATPVTTKVTTTTPVTTTANPEPEAPQDTTRNSTPKQESTEQMAAMMTTSGMEPTTRGGKDSMTTLLGAESTSESIQVIDLEDEAGTTKLTMMVDGRVPL